MPPFLFLAPISEPVQSRPYPERDGLRIWLNRSEQQMLLDWWDEEYPRRRIALELGLHGLRSDEIESVEYRDFRRLDGGDRWALVIRDGKTGRRSPPCSSELKQRSKFLKSAAGLRQDESLIDRSTRTMRSWMSSLREEIYNQEGDERWLALGFHDLRRTWATDTFYSLAFAGVPISEELTMSWGGWKMTDTGRETFRQNYLGPVPDHIVTEAMDVLPYE